MTAGGARHVDGPRTESRGEHAGDADSDPYDDLDAAISASRALDAVAVRSLAGVGADITLTQYRALIVLDTRGAARTVDLAVALGVTPSTATRLCDRLERKEVVQRQRMPHDRRSVGISLTERGRHIVTEMTGRRRAELDEILCRLDPERRRQVVDALRTFAAAAGEASGAAPESTGPAGRP